MLTPSAKLSLTALAALTCIAGGLSLGKKLYEPTVTPETHAVEYKQSDGSLVVERQATTPPEQVQPKHVLPKGSKLERQISIAVQPTTPKEDKVPCPAAHVDLSLVRMPDNTKRVVASSQDGQIVSALDLPTEPVITPKEKKWGAGLAYGTGKRWGAWVDHDAGPFRLGLEVTTNKQHKPEALVRFGIAW